jgi:membrane-associated phospholipid phosphatase
MAANFEGNAGNEGNKGNAGNAGNASSSSGGWFFADRVDLPFVTALDSSDNRISDQRIDVTIYPFRNWSADWYAWLALTEFVGSNWQNFNILPPWAGPSPPYWDSVNAHNHIWEELDDLVTAAQDERADALDEILSQADEFISYFMNLMTTRPTAYPATLRVLNIASLVALFVSMYYKGKYRRPRPSELCPALLPPIVVPGHASFPSGHSTQAHLMALCMGDVFINLAQHQAMLDDLRVLADRIARNREIAGLHYPSDSQAGVDLSGQIQPLLSTNSWYSSARAAARREWDPNYQANQYP